MDGASVSRRKLVLEAGGARSGCSLLRHLAPRTVGTITRSLPLEGNVHRLGASIAYIEARIDSGSERPRTGFRRGDVAFLSSPGALCFFLRDAQARAMTPVGRLDDAGVLESAGAGCPVRLYEETG